MISNLSEPSPLTAGLDAAFIPEAMLDRKLKRALNPWQQGDLIRGLRLFWAGPDGPDPITGLDPGRSEDDSWNVVAWDGGTAAAEGVVRWGAVTSQTCDIAATGPGRSHPTVQVSPLKRLDGLYDPGRIAEVRRGVSTELVYVTVAPELGEWAVDLRISLPVSKTVLAAQERVSAFKSERERLQFSAKVAEKARRPALHDEISGALVTGLRDLVRTAQGNGETWPDQLEQFRLLVTSGDRLEPAEVQLLGIAHGDPLRRSERTDLRAWRDRERRRLSRAAGIALLPIQFVTLSSLDIRRYRESVPLHVPELGRAWI